MGPADRQPGELTEEDRRFLRRCVALARESLEAGDEPFGSLLVDDEGVERFSDRNRVKDGDATRHPEFEIARWAAANLSPRQRRGSVVYTSGEHCPMCSAAHAWVGLGRIVYASSSEQLVAWRRGWGAAPAPVSALPINAVAPDVEVAGPDPLLADEVRALHAKMLGVAET
ncbi:nucleoside deaminase [Actinopolymorpha sp. B11F2]|uniref:nucleoside deaminase n=1 Tax=Actinopolymorpha sp. B11F2 TaxID=3160862 RepID=UPI0032E376BD